MPLIRLVFPIFDRHHYHRFPIWGYEGAMRVLVTILDEYFEGARCQHHRTSEDGLLVRHHPVMRR